MRQKNTSWFRKSLYFLSNYRTMSIITIKQEACARGARIPVFFKNHPLLGGGIIISLLLFLFLIGNYIWNLSPVKIGNKELQLIEIRYGSSLREVSEILKSKNLIHNKLVFEVFVRLNPKNNAIKAGWYHLGPGMSVPGIVKELRRGTPREIRLTVPEGLNINELADLLSKKGLINRERFLAKVFDLKFINSILADFHFSTSPEGYLFPDTYNFMLPITEDEIIIKMLKRFREVYLENFSKVPVTKRRELVIIASLIEEEARKTEERAIIAGVFYNRLRRGQPLESCATVQYVLGTHKKLYNKDLLVDSPYNTYLHTGLPPGPISNPGLASLKAAAFPEQVEYLFFVAKPDGGHIFSRTYQQHLRAKRQIELASRG